MLVLLTLAATALSFLLFLQHLNCLQLSAKTVLGGCVSATGLAAGIAAVFHTIETKTTWQDFIVSLVLLTIALYMHKDDNDFRSTH